jgi:gliding motility-associated-like protein
LKIILSKINLRKSSLLCSVFLSLAVSSLNAQLKANFTSDKNGGCSPLVVRFTNSSTGTTANTSYSWDFGNGNTSTLKDGDAIFTEEKSYTVTLTTAEGTKTSKKSIEITVHKKPVVDFSPSIGKGCVPFPVNFTSTSIPGSGTISSYYWDFGDGYTQQNNSTTQLHTYQLEQKTSVSLTVTNSNGCSSTLQKEGIVNILPAIKTAFTADKTTLCNESDPITFTNSSSGPGTLSYGWDLGDGTSSTEKSPSYIFKKGTYSVKLTVNSSEGCKDSLTRTAYLNIADYNTDFEAPPLVCTYNSASFINKSRPFNYNYKWTVNGVEQWSWDGHLYFNFSTAGDYMVSLTQKFGDCQASSTKKISVKKSPELNGFITELEKLCSSPIKVTFKDTSSEAVKWEWDATYQYYNPKITSTLKENTFEYSTNDYYQANLKITDAEGCSNSVTKQINLSKPGAEIRIEGVTQLSELHSCGPVTFKLTAVSSAEITEYKWIFSDGTTSIEKEPTHTFSALGTHGVRLEFVTADGCKNSTYYPYTIAVYDKVKADFNLTLGTTICGDTRVFFQDLSTGPTLYKYWVIDSQFVTSDYEYRFQTPGKHTVQFIVANNGCRDTMTKVDYVDVIPFSNRLSPATYTCDGDRGLVTFKQTSTGVTKWEWDFGDGTTKIYSTDQAVITHQYTKSGNYYVTLKYSNDQCTATNSLNIYVALKQNPVLTALTTNLCEKESFHFTISDDPQTTNPSLWHYYHLGTWQYGDGSFFKGWNNYPDIMLNPSYQGVLQNMDAPRENIRVIMQDGNLCYDTSNYVSVTISKCTPLPPDGPPAANAGFKFTTSFIGTAGCLPLLVNYTNTSTNYLKVKWDFGDGTLADDVSFPNHIYTKPGTYIVKLFVYDSIGLADTYIDSVTIATRPDVTLNTDNLQGCIGHTAHFAADEMTNLSYLWDFGDGNVQTTKGSDTNHQYQSPGRYTASLILRDVNGCLFAAEGNKTIAIQPNPIISINPDQPKACLGKPLDLIASGGTNYKWTPTEGLSNSSISNPVATPGTTTTYKVEVSNEIGCKSEKSIEIEVIQPFKLSVSRDAAICAGDKLTLTAAAANTYKWINNTSWLNSTNVASPIAMPPSSTEYTVVGYDSYGCFSDTATIRLTVHPLPIVNAGSDVQVMSGTEVQLTATSQNEISSWRWSPETYLSCTSCISPVSVPRSELNYIVTGKDKNGCIASDTVRIKLQCEESLVAIPSAFTPNGDGKNDFFTIKGILMIKHLTIFNRWGNIVFERNNFDASAISNCWNGNSKGLPQPIGSYVYFVEMQCPSGEPFVQKGTVTLLR